ncbi:uncharacterized protein HKW66_Vig0038910 [Vigna angularis]|uniref:Uncharacterized protein n=1 Tax=Phaseolus angularis TaxID=3914 RepID=A0A8T0LAE2_PHAAN|nr:uncharacterized protein HKW66_Vig0038910 [Vigna angularis]
MAKREGVGLRTRILMSLGLVRVLTKRLSRAPNMTCSASSLVVGFLAEAIAEENLALEIEGGWEEVASKGGVVDELLEVDGEVIWGTVAGDVEEVDDGGGAGHDVEDGSVSSHVPRVKKENGEHTWQDVSQLS